MKTNKLIGNNLIHKFMGYEYIPENSHPHAYENYGWWIEGTYTNDADPRDNENFYGFNGDLKYHSSWDSLMVVVEKIVYDIVGKKHDLNTEDDIEYFDEIGKQWQKLQYAQITPVVLSEQKPIDQIYNAVVDFINWYNTKHAN